MEIRDTSPADAAEMAELLNAIIAIGGTTAHQEPKTPDQVRQGYIDGPGVRTSVLACEGGRVIGWQSIEHWEGGFHIGSFVRPGIQARGVGAAMFARTLAQARAAGIPEIIASIRADNVPGLAFYAKMGFRDFAQDPDFALKDGRVVGRVHRKLSLV
ncbi:GNAT family N-acetyltransferase [Stagnihabitans tardus]|uniref:GNAT family N-acetyltransferase n=1 Tax=Stagnihabitans tardus TaxID=2699202 RepID=A0AAE4Y658_9RHOB|nr:GNAT family N-acetyltransferase [Stagnihabitans tardus]NBZ86536.1 GNAT family N-acetyltransferase [Stagnihabitans tardus]